LPDLSNPDCYDKAKAIFAASPDSWHIGSIRGFTFSVARKLRRMDRYLIDLLLEREKVEILHDRIDALIKTQMKRLSEVGADCIMFAEDWGSQDRLLVRPALWRERFRPRFADLCSFAHALGLKVFMHSCGKMTDIIPDLIEVGVDLLQFDQPRIHGIDILCEMQQLTPITFWCPVDIQRTLQTKDEARIRQEVRELLEKLWRGEGGFVAGFYPDEPSIGLEPKWQQMACNEFLKRGSPGSSTL
jgi:uroporphyrinogen-III decarboxylase